MRNLQTLRARAFLALSLSLAACSGGAASPDGSGGDGSSPAGTVTLRLIIPAGRSFCDQSTACGNSGHIAILDAAGKGVGTSVPWCSTFCSATCQPSPCPGIACIPQGFTVTTTELQWDGSTYKASTCGNKMPCYQPVKVPAGHYIARMCATPGTISAPDGGGQPTCTATGPVECVDRPFDFPGSSLVEGMLAP